MSPRKPRARIVALAVATCLLAAIVTGCQSSNGSTPPSGSGAAITPSQLPGAGASSQPIVAGAKPVSMTLLPNWKEVELTDAGVRSVLDSVATSNPLLAKTLTDLLASRGYTKFALYAIGYAGDRYLGSVNVSESPATAIDLAGLGQLFEGQLRDVGATDLTSKVVTLPAGPAVQLGYSLTVTSGSAAPPGTVNGRLYVFLVGGITYDVTFSCVGPDSTHCLAQADQMIQTFRIGS